MTRERICKKCGESEKEIRKQARFDGATFGCCRVWSGYLFSRHSYAYKDDEGKAKEETIYCMYCGAEDADVRDCGCYPSRL